MTFIQTTQSTNEFTYAAEASHNMLDMQPEHGYAGELPAVDVYQTGSYCLVASQMMVGVHPSDLVVDVSFDPLEELVWCITRMGQMTAFYSPTMEKYISNTVPLLSTTGPHMDVPCSGELKQIYPSLRTAEHSVYVLASNALYAYNKFGWQITCKNNEHMLDLECFVMTGPNGSTPNGSWGCTNGTLGYTRMYAGGLQSSLLEFDAQDRWGELLRPVDVGNGGSVVLRTFANGLCAGTTCGKVLVVDPRTTKGVVRQLDAHSGEISDMAVVPYSYTLVTSGWSQLGGAAGLRVDRLLKVYDLRSGRAQVPLTTSLDPSFTRFFPGSSDRLLAASQAGGFQTIQWDNHTVSPADLGQLWPTYDRLVALDISQNGSCLVFSTETGQLQLYSTNMNQCQFNRDPHPTEFASSAAESLLPANCVPGGSLSNPSNILSDSLSNPLIGTNLLPVAKAAARSVELQLLAPSLHQPNIVPTKHDESLYDVITRYKTSASVEAVNNAYKPVDYDDEDFSSSSIPFLADPPPPQPSWETDSTDGSPKKNRPISSADWPADMCKLPARTMLPVDPELLSAVNSMGTVRKPPHWGFVWHPYSADPNDPSDPLNCDMTFGRFVSVNTGKEQNKPEK